MVGVSIEMSKVHDLSLSHKLRKISKQISNYAREVDTYSRNACQTVSHSHATKKSCIFLTGCVRPLRQLYGCATVVSCRVLL